MHPAGVGVPPEALQRLVVIEGGRTRGLEEPVDGRDRPAGGANLVAAGTGPQFHRDLLALAQQRVLLGEIAAQLSPGGVDVTGRLGDTHLGERIVFRLLAGERGAHPLALVLHVGIVSAVGHTHDRGGYRGGMHCAPGHPIDRRGIGLEPAGRTVVHRPV